MKFICKLKKIFTGDNGGDIKPCYEPELSDHPVYKTIDTYKKFNIVCLKITNPIKKRMAIRYLTILYTHLYDFLKCLTNDDNITMYVDNLSLISDGIIDAINITEDESLGDGIPKIFLNKMKEFQFEYFNIIMNTIVDIQQSSYYMTNKLLITSILDMMLLYVRVIMNNTENTINNMNGELQAALQGTIFDDGCE